MKFTPYLLCLLLAACSPRNCDDPKEFIERTALADIEIRYLRTTVRAMTCQARQWVDAELVEFRKSLPKSSPSPDWRHQFKASGRLHSAGPGLEAAELEAFFFTGGAHPNSKVFTLNYAYDKKGWYPIKLATLFKPGVDWHALLLPYARKAAEKLNTDKAWVSRGLEDKGGQWSRFAMESGGLVLIFEPYQVAPYAAGRVRVKVPWQDLKGQLNERWFLKL